MIHYSDGIVYKFVSLLFIKTLEKSLIEHTMDTMRKGYLLMILGVYLTL